MKYVAYAAGVRTPKYLLATSDQPVDLVAADLAFPLFVKAAHAGDSRGIDARSLVRDRESLDRQVAAMHAEFRDVLVEEYIEGRELTVLIVASPDERGDPIALMPVEYVFPTPIKYKTYANKTSELHPDANIPVHDAALAARVRDAAMQVFRGFEAVGYGRMDFRGRGRQHLLSRSQLHLLGILRWRVRRICRLHPQVRPTGPKRVR